MCTCVQAEKEENLGPRRVESHTYKYRRASENAKIKQKIGTFSIFMDYIHISL